MNDKKLKCNALDCQEINSMDEQLRISSEEQDANTDNLQQNAPATVVPQTSSIQLAMLINSRIKDYDDHICIEHYAIKALRKSKDEDEIRTKVLLQSNNSMKEQIDLNVKYCDRIKSFRDRLQKSNITIEKYLASLKMKVRTKEQDSAKFGGQLKGHIDCMKQKWEEVYHKYDNKPQFKQIMTLQKSLNELKRTKELKEQQMKDVKVKQLENCKGFYSGYGYKSFQEIVIKIAQIKLETLNIVKEIEDMYNQIENLNRMEVDELETETITENHAEVILVEESLVTCDDHMQINTEDNTEDITDIAAQQDVVIEEETAHSVQISDKYFQNSPAEICLQTICSQEFFTPPSTTPVVSCESSASFSVAKTQETFTSPLKTPSIISVLQSDIISHTNQSTIISSVPSSIQRTAPTPHPVFTSAKIQSAAAFAFVPPTPKTPKRKSAVPGFSLKTPRQTKSFNLGLSNTDSPFSLFQTISNKDTPEATTEKYSKQRPSKTGSENLRSPEENSFLFQPTTQQSASFFGTKTQTGESESFNLGSFLSTPKEFSKYFSNDTIKGQEVQSEPFSQSIFGKGNPDISEENANKTVNQGFSFFNF